MHRGITEKKQTPKEVVRLEHLYTVLIVRGKGTCTLMCAQTQTDTHIYTYIKIMVHSAFRSCNIMKSPQGKHFSKDCTPNQIVRAVLAFCVY